MFKTYRPVKRDPCGVLFADSSPKGMDALRFGMCAQNVHKRPARAAAREIRIKLDGMFFGACIANPTPKRAISGKTADGVTV